MHVWRPCDTVETVVAWSAAIERAAGPTSLLLTRQSVPFVKRTPEQLDLIRRGGYVLSDAGGAAARCVIIATGSEVALALQAQQQLASEGIGVRVVSMPSTSVFDNQDEGYRESVLPRGVPRIAVEAGVPDYWCKYVGLEGAVIGIGRFGESAPAGELFRHFGFTPENVVAVVKAAL